MSVKERIHELVEDIPPERLEEAERMLKGLVPSQAPTAGMKPDEREARLRAFIAKHKGGPPLTQEEREELLALGRGISAHLPGSVDEFMRQKHEDTEREEARLAPRSAA